MKYKTTRKAIVNAQSTGTPERVERLLQEFCKLNGGAV